MSYETEICTLKWKESNIIKVHFLSLAITSKVTKEVMWFAEYKYCVLHHN